MNERREQSMLLRKLVTAIAIIWWTGQASAAPYPPSQVIESISWDFSNAVQLANGSDLWPVSWGSDNHLYTAWGDGDGFGSDGSGRASLGISRIEGPPTGLVEYGGNRNVFNVNGGSNAENSPTWPDPPGQIGKMTGILFVNGVLYGTKSDENYNPDPDFRIVWSNDNGASWTEADWVFPNKDFVEVTFLNYGRDYAGVPAHASGYVYLYGILNQDDPITTGDVYLARVPEDSVATESAYEWFSGLNGSNNPTWTSSFSSRQPVFSDPNKVAMSSVSYIPALQRYILTVPHGNRAGGLNKLGVFDSERPWGPWSTIEYYDNWGGLGNGLSLGFYVPTKSPEWMSSDGKTIHVIFSSDTFDSFNMVKGTLTLNSEPENDPSPSKPTNLTVE